MIQIYPFNATNFDRIGCVLMPTACTVNEDAGGAYECSITHPIDSEDKWLKVAVGSILKVPVPKINIPEAAITIPASGGVAIKTWYTTKAATTVYQLPSDRVVAGYIPSGQKCPWAFGEDGDYVLIETPFADIGRAWVKKDDVDRYDEEIPLEGQPETVYSLSGKKVDSQLFRVFEANVSSDGMTVSAKARHVSYDMLYAMAGSGFDKSVYEGTAGGIIGAINRHEYYGGPDGFFVATDLPGDLSYSENFAYKPITSVISDPDNGLVPLYRLQLIRDNWTTYLFRNNPVWRGITIAYGKNLRSIRYTTNTDDVVTAVLPVGIYEDREFVIDTENSGWPRNYFIPSDADPTSNPEEMYPFLRFEVLSVPDVEPGFAGWETMKDAALRRFTEDRVHLMKMTIDVDFVDLARTEEYKHYAHLQNVFLYDVVHLVHAPLGIDLQLQVKAYEWDALRETYTRITLGDPFSNDLQTLPTWGYRDQSITLDKLDSVRLARFIKSVNEE